MKVPVWQITKKVISLTHTKRCANRRAAVCWYYCVYVICLKAYLTSQLWLYFQITFFIHTPWAHIYIQTLQQKEKTYVLVHRHSASGHHRRQPCSVSSCSWSGHCAGFVSEKLLFVRGESHKENRERNKSVSEMNE